MTYTDNISWAREVKASETDWWQASDGNWYPPNDDKDYALPHFRYPWECLDVEGRTLGTARDPGEVIVLSLLTLGIYGLYWQYATFKELKAYSGSGIGGPLGLLLAFSFGVATAFLLPSEIGAMYARASESEPTSAKTGFWYLIPIIGWIMWTIRVQSALNIYWSTHRSPPPPGL